MAIKDSILREVLNVEPVILTSNHRYRRLREIEYIPDQKRIKRKLETNRGQTRDETGVKLETNRRQIKDVLSKNWSQTGVRTEDINGDKRETNQGQTRDKNIGSKSYFSLTGLQLKITHFIYAHCKASRSKITQPLSIEHISFSCNIKCLSIKKTIQRLEKKGILLREKYKVGRNGWTCYGLPDALYKEILHAEENPKLEIKRRQTEDKLESELETEPETNYSSSSSSLYRDTTTAADSLLPPEWKLVDLKPLQEIGLTPYHLSQLAKQNKLPIEIVQDSIYAFAFDLKQNGKASQIKGSPLRYFMGVLHNGHPYAPPANYESPQDASMRLYVERKEAVQQRRQALETEAAEFSFNEWLEKEVTEVQKQQIIPSAIYRLQAEAPKLGTLRKHFMEAVWPEKRKAILEGCHLSG